MKITVNGKKHGLGEALGRQSCKVGIDKLSELSGIHLGNIQLVSFKNKNGPSGDMILGQKVIAIDGTAFTVTTRESASPAPEN